MLRRFLCFIGWHSIDPDWVGSVCYGYHDWGRIVRCRHCDRVRAMRFYDRPWN